jgi:hypothetical protein
MSDDEVRSFFVIEYARLDRLEADIERWKASHDGEKPDLLVGLHAITGDRLLEVFMGWEPNRIERYRPN